MKKLLALVLALVMTLSLATVGTNAFTDDAKVKADYSESVKVLTGMGVFKGYEDNSFRPEGDITRAEVAAIVYRIYTGDVTDKQASVYAGYGKFDDVNAASWYAGYVGYCTNAGFIKGYGDGKFGPNDKVTGYQALAMILRAVGYGKNGEFEGKDWELHVAQIAQQINALKNVKGEVLKNPASRQLVAELLFQCLNADQVVYTPAFGYTPVAGIGRHDSLGQKVFGLKYSYDNDVWGRPAKIWKYSTGNYKTTIAETPVASYTVKVDECDISKDLGINSSEDIEKAFIDGEEYKVTNTAVTTNGVGTINPRATTSYVGAQGRLTEVYDMGSEGYRIVEINTYLANVTKVTAEKTDKNGHKTAATVDLAVWMGTRGTTAFRAVEAAGFTKGEYVLVTISNPNDAKKAAIESVEAAPIVAAGNLTGWTNGSALKAATHLFGKTAYNDADKFFLNWRVAGSWAVLTDKYGNAIGLAQVANNYLVVEKIEWKHNATSFGGYALADLVLADGTKVANATIATINGEAANNHYDYYPMAEEGEVSDHYWNNQPYYGHILTYSVNENGSYNIANIADFDKQQDEGAHPGFDNPADVEGATITKGKPTINSDTNRFVATDKTVFLLADDPGEAGTTYTAYVGKNNVPSIVDADLCILTDSNGYAVLVVASDYADKGTRFIAYVTDDKVDVKRGSYEGHLVYKLGETDPTAVYDKQDLLAAAFENDGTGLYYFTLDASGFITSVKVVTIDLSTTKGYNYNNKTYAVNRAAVKADELGNSFPTYGYSNLAELDDVDNEFGYTFTKTEKPVADYNLTKDTKFILVTKSGVDTKAPVINLVEGTIDDIKADAVVLVAYDDDDAEVVYVLVNTGFEPVISDKFDVKVEKYTADSENGVEIVLSLTNRGEAVAITEKNVNLAKSKLDVINDATKLGLYSTELEGNSQIKDGKLVITIPAKPVKGDYYYAEGTLYVVGEGYVPFKTVAKQATDAAAASSTTETGNTGDAGAGQK